MLRYLPTDETGQDMASALSALGSYYLDWSRFGAAGVLLERTVQCYGIVYTDGPTSEGDRGRLGVIYNMGKLYHLQWKHGMAMEWYERALVGQEKALGKGHLDTLRTAYNTANIFYYEGRYSMAMEWYGRALVGWEKALGKDHPDTLRTVSNIADVFHDQGEHNMAMEWYGRALAGQEKVLGKDHPDTLTTAKNIEATRPNIPL